MKKKTHPLNVLTYGYYPWRYITNWFRNIRIFFRNLKFAYQRVTRGYCDWDTWELYDYYTQLFYYTLRDLADNTHGCPGWWHLEGKSHEDWENHLREIADHFYKSQEDAIDVEVNVLRDRAWDAMEAQVLDYEVDEDNTLIKKLTNQEHYEELKEEWLQFEEKASIYRDEEKNKGMDMLKDVFFDLWD